METQSKQFTLSFWTECTCIIYSVVNYMLGVQSTNDGSEYMYVIRQNCTDLALGGHLKGGT